MKSPNFFSELETAQCLPRRGRLHGGAWLLMQASSLTPALLRLDPMFDLLRNDPRFQKLAGGNISAALRENRRLPCAERHEVNESEQPLSAPVVLKKW